MLLKVAVVVCDDGARKQKSRYKMLGPCTGCNVIGTNKTQTVDWDKWYRHVDSQNEIV